MVDEDRKAALLARADWLEAQLQAALIPPRDGEDWKGVMDPLNRQRSNLDALAGAIGDLPDRPGRVRSDPAHGCRIIMLGIAASSTAGMSHAARSWITKARAAAGAE